MESRTIRRTSVTLPALSEAGLYLSNITSLEGSRGRVAEFVYADADVRELDLAEAQLMDGRITRLRAQRVRLDQLRIDSVEFSGCDLSSLQWTDSKLSRATFTDCKLMGGLFEDLTLENVLFENCKLDYATISRVRATGPVIFTRCSLREVNLTGTNLREGLFDECDLRLTEFDGGTYRGCDLRGNDLSSVLGINTLKQIIIDRPQTLQLAEALAAELDITYGEDFDDT